MKNGTELCHVVEHKQGMIMMLDGSKQEISYPVIADSEGIGVGSHKMYCADTCKASVNLTNWLLGRAGTKTAQGKKFAKAMCRVVKVNLLVKVVCEKAVQQLMARNFTNILDKVNNGLCLKAGYRRQKKRPYVAFSKCGPLTGAVVDKKFASYYESTAVDDCASDPVNPCVLVSLDPPDWTNSIPPFDEYVSER